MANTDQEGWERIYPVAIDAWWNKCAAIGFITVFAIYWTTRGGWYGPVISMISVGYLAWILYTSTRMDIVCNSDGCSVCSVSYREGKTVQFHRWNEIVSTFYSPSDVSEEGSPKAHFEASTRHGRLFMMLETMPSFGEVIEMFNASTPHLPYEWKAKTGSFGSTHYERIDRVSPSI